MKHQTTIKDIAKALGIATSTVSRALKNHPNISDATKKKVQDAAFRMRYEPNRIAQSLKKRQSKTIGVIVPEIIHFFFSTIISGIEEVAYANGYTVMICQSNESYKKECLDTSALRSHQVDGVLVSHSRESTNFAHFEDLQINNIPLVFFDRVPEAMSVPKVVINDFEAAKQATQHLIGQGCTRIAHFAGSLNLIISQERKRGYIAALEENDIAFDENLIIDCKKGTKEIGYKRMMDLLKTEEEIDAIFTNNDILAIGAMLAVKDYGLQIPNDISIVGFSNWEISSITDPKLTSISQPGLEMGRIAMETLIEIIEGRLDNDSNITKELPSRLIVRGSSNKNKSPLELARLS